MQPLRFGRLLIVAALLASFVFVTNGLRAQPQTVLIATNRPVVLYAKTSPATAQFLLPETSRNRIQSVNITVNYKGFPAAAQAAFQRAVDIWAGELSSTVPIVIDAEWSSTLSPGVLGAATTQAVVANFANAPQQNILYPVALANKIVGKDLDPTRADILAVFNGNLTNWYLGTDGNAPANTYDLVTVVLHEIGHGLGFAGIASVSNGVGELGYESLPLSYESFVVNGSGQQLTNTSLFPNPSTALGSQMTGGNLFFNGQNAIAAAGTRPKLYAPSVWEQGSSFSHLDEATYPTGSANGLMTPALDDGEVIHDIGAITRGVFNDIGWSVEPQQRPTDTRTSTSGTAPSATRTATTAPGALRKNFLPVVAQGGATTSPTSVAQTPSRTLTASASATRSPSASATSTQAASATRTATSGTPTQTLTASSTATPSTTVTASNTSTVTQTPSNTATSTPTSTYTRTPSPTQTATPSRTPTITSTPEGT